MARRTPGRSARQVIAVVVALLMLTSGLITIGLAPSSPLSAASPLGVGIHAPSRSATPERTTQGGPTSLPALWPQTRVGPAPPTSVSLRSTLVLFNSSLITGNFLAGNGERPLAAAYDSAKGEVFLVNQGTNNVSVVSTLTNKVIAVVPVGDYPSGAAYDGGKGEVFVANSFGRSITVISDTTNTVVATVAVGADPVGVAYDTDRAEVFVSNVGSDNVSVISDTTNAVVASVPVGGGPSALTYDAGRGEVFVGNAFTNNVSVISDATNKVVGTVAVGSYPVGIAYDAGKDDVYVANYASNNVSVVSDTTNLVTATVRVGATPSAITYDSGKAEVFAANIGSNNVSVISDSTNAVVASVNVGSAPGAAAYDAADAEVFIANEGSNNASVISDASNTVVASVGVGSYPNGVAYDSSESELFVADGGSNELDVIADSTNAVVAKVPVGAGPYAVVYDSGQREIFVANSYSDTVSVVSDSTNTVVATVHVGIDPSALAYDSGKGEVFVTNGDSGDVSVIDDTSNTVVATIPVWSSPMGAAYDSGLGEVFVTNQQADNVSVISDSTNEVVASVAVGIEPSGIAYDPGQAKVFVANGGSRNVSVISDATNRVLANIAVGSSPTGLAYDRADGDVLVTNYYHSDNVSVIDDATDVVVASVDVGSEPIGIAWDAGTGNTYVANYAQGTTSILGRAGSSTMYQVQFTETGLPSGTMWAVTFNGTREQTSSTTITFQSPNGTYPYSVSNVAGWRANSYSGSLSVTGAPKGLTVSWTHLTYTVTFMESGLSGASWAATLNGNTSTHTTDSSITLPIGNGTFHYNISAPPGWEATPSTGTVVVAGEAPSAIAIAFTQPTEALQLSPAQGPIDAAYTVTGSGFTASSHATVSFNGTLQAPTGTSGGQCIFSKKVITTTSAGGFVCAFKVPNIGPGGYPVVGHDSSSGLSSVPETFTVTAPEILVSPTSGSVGAAFTVKGSGFSVSAMYGAEVYFYPEGFLTPVGVSGGGCTFTVSSDTTFIATNSTGGFVCSFAVPNVAPAADYLYAVDAATNQGSPFVDFTVLAVAPAITLNPTRGAVGSEYTITGTGFTVSSGAYLLFGPASTQSPSGVSGGACVFSGYLITTNDTGGFVCTYVVPSLSPDRYQVGMVDRATNLIGNAQFTITIGAAIEVTPPLGPMGATYTVTGLGFTASSTAVVEFNGVALPPTPPSGGSCVFSGTEVTTSASGGFTCVFGVPSVPPGIYDVVGVDGHTGNATAPVPFDVTTPILTVNPTQGPVGEPVNVSGTGFSPNYPLAELTFDDVTIVMGIIINVPCTSGSTIANASGSFSCWLNVPRYTGGSGVVATDVGGGYAYTRFTVTTPTITVRPSSGPVGSTVTVNGTGFSPGPYSGSPLDVQLTFDSVAISACLAGSLSTEGSGDFSCTLSVPNGTAGSSVRAVDPWGIAQATTTFTVTSASTGEVRFIESGLPASPIVTWSVTLDGAILSSQSTVISFTVAANSYSYRVGSSNDSWGTTPTAGRVNVGASSTVTVNLAFARVYPLTFSLTPTPGVGGGSPAPRPGAPSPGGLPSGTLWYVNVTGTVSPDSSVRVPAAGVVNLSYSTNTTTLAFSLPNGTWSYMVGSADPSWTSGIPPAPVVVDGAAPAPVAVRFIAAYAVVFTETGLPGGLSWSVTFNGTAVSSNSTTITFYAANGTAAFTVAMVPGYSASPSSGSVRTDGMEAGQSVHFTSTAGSSSFPSWGWIAIGGAIAVVVGAIAVVLVLRKRRS